MTTTYDLTNPKKPTIEKDPNAILDYSEDWADWCTDAGNDTISSHEVLFEDASTLALVSSSVTANVVTAFISGGTVGNKERVVMRVTTTGGRTDDRSIYLKIVER